MKYKDISCLHIDEYGQFHNKKIVIYGAGTYGKILLFLLKLKRMESNILGFAVSDREGNPDSVFGKSVKQLEDIYSDNKFIIIIAVDEKNIKGILSKLEKKGINNFYWFSTQSVIEAGEYIFNIHQKYPVKKNKIFIYCYNGMGYCCNCKYIAEKLIEGRYPVEIIWAVNNKREDDIPDVIKKVELYTEECYRELYTSGICITNSVIDLLWKKRKGQFCINTWHGYGPFKKVIGALPEYDEKKTKAYFSGYDLFVTASKFYSDVYRKSFFYNGEILECGAPRNDIFFADNHIKDKIYNYYQIPPEKKIILFAPTFRYDKTAVFDKYDFDPEQIVYAIRKGFQKEYIWMYRFHHQLHGTKKRMDYYTYGIDATLYPDVQELLVAADIVITDYSSLMWDFSLQRKPVFLYQKDLEEYEDERGFYAPVSEWPYPQAHTQEELIRVIENFDDEKYIQELNLFLNKYGSCDNGHASECVVKRIMKEIKGEDNAC